MMITTQQTSNDEHADEETSLVRERYSAFSKSQKKLIIFTAALASTFSPFSANIYYPALNSIAADLHVSASLMNLTITTYMVFSSYASYNLIVLMPKN